MYIHVTNKYVKQASEPARNPSSVASGLSIRIGDLIGKKRETKYSTILLITIEERAKKNHNLLLHRATNSPVDPMTMQNVLSRFHPSLLN